MNKQFSDRVALVVGGGTGIGRAAACTFAAHGAKVVVATRSEEQGLSTVRFILDAGGTAALHCVDATSEAAVRGMIDFAVATFGRLDMALNNVGHPGPYAGIAKTTLEAFEECHRRNTLSCFLAMKYELPQMLEAGGGAIVNTTSLAGIVGSPGMSAYTAAKHAVNGLTRTAALEYAARGIRINAIAPGATDTPMLRCSLSTRAEDDPSALQRWTGPMGRLATAQEQADVAVWLCSDAARFVNGQIIPVDGGETAGKTAPDPAITNPDRPDPATP